MLTSLLAALIVAAPLQSPEPSPPARPSPRGEPASDRANGAPAKEEAPVVTQHELRVGRTVLKYTVTAGRLPLRNEATGEIEAQVFFMAYVAERTGGPETRPLMFSFNGGPGSSSVWLHLGALGPRRVKMLADGGLPAAPYELVDNEHTWLTHTDLVFIDPVGTGYSRAAKPELAKKYFGLQGDVESVGEFIRLYLSRHRRWRSPLFLVGESYGTTRAAGLAGHLIDRGIAFNGIVLVSSILNFQTARFQQGNDLPYVLFLPTYTATAWYHKKLSAELQARPLADVLAEAERFAAGPYPALLAKGDAVGDDERRAGLAELARLTGLQAAYLERVRLRPEASRFRKELLRDEGRSVGRLDSRFKGIDASAAAERPDFDPSMAAIRPPYTATFNDYVRRELGYESDLVYHILGGGIGPWDFGAENRYADVTEELRDALVKNPYMKLFVASGYYDLATPYFATDYTLAHIGLDQSLKVNLRTAFYEAGHMMYIHEGELAKLKQDLASFVAWSLPGGS